MEQSKNAKPVLSRGFVLKFISKTDAMFPYVPTVTVVFASRVVSERSTGHNQRKGHTHVSILKSTFASGHEALKLYRTT